jgi:hypothetical protein
MQMRSIGALWAACMGWLKPTWRFARHLHPCRTDIPARLGAAYRLAGDSLAAGKVANAEAAIGHGQAAIAYSELAAERHARLAKK